MFMGLLLATTPAHAIRYDQLYIERVETAERISPVAADGFGEHLNLKNGAVEFNYTDIDIPGNSALPVRLQRSHAVEDRGSSGNATLRGFSHAGSIDIPYLSGTFGQGGWQVSGTTPNARCSQGGAPPSFGSMYSNDYWNGNTLHIPWAGDQLMLKEIAGSVPKPSGYSPLVTKDLWRFKCKPSTKNGYPGEAFIAVSPSGDEYTFDWVVSRPIGSLSKRIGNYSSSVSINRQVVYFLVTEIKDRFGNTVNYTYSGDKLQRIEASDGRYIQIAARSGDNITRVESSVGTWTYAYSPGEVVVTQPDGATWRYQESGVLDIIPEPSLPVYEGSNRCPAPPVSMGSYGYTVTHPAGAQAQFQFGVKRHYRHMIPKMCNSFLDQAGPSTTYQFLSLPNYSDTFTLNTKTVTGQDLAPMQWSYQYGVGSSGLAFAEMCAIALQPEIACRKTVFTITRGPGGLYQKHEFGAWYEYNEGRLISLAEGEETMQGSPAQPVVRIHRTTTYEYATDQAAADGPYPDRVGYDQHLWLDDISTSALRPQTKKTVTLHHSAGDTNFILSHGEFDALARPVRSTRSSTLPGNPSRTERTTYWDLVSKWVLGQVSRVELIASTPALSGLPLEISRTTFDPVSALPTETFSFTKPQQKLTYNANGTVASVSDARDSGSFDTTIQLQNWKRGIPQTVRYPATPEAPTGAILGAVVNDRGLVTAVTSETGATTSYLHDDMGRVTQVTYPLEDPSHGVTWNATTSDFSRQAGKYGLSTHWRRLTRTGNGWKVVRYDALWRPVIEEQYDNADDEATRSIIVKRYDAAGRLAFQSHPLRTLTDYRTVTAGTYTEYDALGRVTKTRVPSVDGPGGWFSTTTEYLAGLAQRVTSPNLVQTTTRFMAWDEPTTDYPVAIVHPEGAFTDITRNAFGNPTAITRRDATSTVSVTRTYTYNAYQELCRSVEPETGATLMGYDAAGNLAWSAAGLSAATGCHATGTTPAISARRVDREYDARNRLKALDFPDGNGNQTWDYYADGKPKQIATWNIGFPGADPKETRNLYTYYKRGLLKTELIAVPAWYTFSVEHGYNANGFETALTYPSGHTVTSAVNALGQPTSISGGAQTYASGIKYHPNGAVVEFYYGNQIRHTMVPNDRMLPDTVSSKYGSTEFLDDQYDYDGHGNVLSIVDDRTGKAGRRSRTMTYDNLDRLTKVASPMYGSTGANYTYNVLDDIRKVTIGGAQARNHDYCYSTNRRLATVRTGGCSGTVLTLMSYDVQGNVATRSGQGYYFDFGNRLREVDGVERYRYDGHGRRVLAMNFVQGTVLSQYGFDGRLMYQKSDRTSLQSDHVYLGSSLIAIREAPFSSSAAVVKYQHTDALGSPVVVTRQDREIVEETEYEPYGKVLNRPMHDGAGYTGHVEDAATALVYMQQRYYDPGIGRFLSVDPVTAYDTGDMRQFNRYAYANSNPYKFTDPDGRVAHVVGGGIVGGLIGGGVELYKQANSGQKISWGKVGGEALKGATVGAVTAALPGAGAAMGLSANGARALTATGAVAAGSTGEAAAQAVRGESLDGGKIAIAGASNLLGVGAGSAAAAPARAASTVTTEAIEGVTVTSLRGRSFTIGAVPATSSTNVVQQQAMQDVVGESASSAMNEAANRLIDRER